MESACPLCSGISLTKSDGPEASAAAHGRTVVVRHLCSILAALRLCEAPMLMPSPG